MTRPTGGVLAAGGPVPAVSPTFTAGRAATIFLAFALAYFLSTLVRAITATLSPTLTAEFGLRAQDLGLLAGGYFLGFAFTQLPMGAWLDRYGPKRVTLGFLGVAVGGCILFSLARDFWTLMLARVLTGVGVSACLMAPLTGYRRWFDPGLQLRSNSWMLMVGSLGLVASTLPVQWLLPRLGWRPLFWILAAGVAVSMAIIAKATPAWQSGAPAREKEEHAIRPAPRQDADAGYRAIWRNAYFRRLVPIGFFNYGGFVAMLTLWVGPWLTRVAGYSPAAAADGLFHISLAMLAAYWLWGLVNPWFARRRLSATQLLQWCLPISMLALLSIIILGPRAGAGAWSLFLCSSTVVALAQPAVAMALPPQLAGRALSAYNLVVFLGVFVIQWMLGLLMDALTHAGLDQAPAFQGALLVFLGGCIASYVYFLWAAPHNQETCAHPE